MTRFLVKTLVSALVIATASEVAKRSSVLAAVLLSLPLTSVLALTWLWIDTGSRSDVSRLSLDILILVAPSVVFFAVLSLLLRAAVLPVPVALLTACLAMAAAYAGWIRLVDRLGWT